MVCVKVSVSSLIKPGHNFSYSSFAMSWGKKQPNKQQQKKSSKKPKQTEKTPNKNQENNKEIRHHQANYDSLHYWDKKN